MDVFQYQVTAHEVLEDSKKIFEDVIQLVKEGVDPQFEDLDIFERVKIIMENKETTPGWNGEV